MRQRVPHAFVQARRARGRGCHPRAQERLAVRAEHLRVHSRRGAERAVFLVGANDAKRFIIRVVRGVVKRGVVKRPHPRVSGQVRRHVHRPPRDPAPRLEPRLLVQRDAHVRGVQPRRAVRPDVLQRGAQERSRDAASAERRVDDDVAAPPERRMRLIRPGLGFGTPILVVPHARRDADQRAGVVEDPTREHVVEPQKRQPLVLVGVETHRLEQRVELIDVRVAGGEPAQQVVAPALRDAEGLVEAQLGAVAARPRHGTPSVLGLGHLGVGASRGARAAEWTMRREDILAVDPTSAARRAARFTKAGSWPSIDPDRRRRGRRDGHSALKHGPDAPSPSSPLTARHESLFWTDRVSGGNARRDSLLKKRDAGVARVSHLDAQPWRTVRPLARHRRGSRPPRARVGTRRVFPRAVPEPRLASRPRARPPPPRGRSRNARGAT